MIVAKPSRQMIGSAHSHAHSRAVRSPMVQKVLRSRNMLMPSSRVVFSTQTNNQEQPPTIDSYLHQRVNHEFVEWIEIESARRSVSFCRASNGLLPIDGIGPHRATKAGRNFGDEGYTQLEAN
jgi:hypothetical protein